METIVKAATTKFGKVMLCVLVDASDNPQWKLLIKRDNTPFKDAPFMTISASLNNGNPDFYWGHYDMAQKSASRAAVELAEQMSAFV